MSRVSPLKLSEECFAELGITAYGWIKTEQIVFSKEVRDICAGNRCRHYGKTWACPPAVGTFEECKEKCLSYSRALVFSATYPLEDSFDYEGMKHGHRAFKQVCDHLYEVLEKPFLLLSNEGCIRCEKCTYPELPCRFPDKLFPSVEGYGILVYETAKNAGMAYRYGADSVTYFGLVCFD